MQNFPDSILLQQATCGALWAVTRDSDSYKNIAISAGTIDAIVCLILVHPHDVGVLESALKFLASLSSVKKCAKEVANASGIDVVVEAMRSNSSSIELIRNGSLFIQNMAFADSGYADQAVQGITSILHCMDEHPDCVRLVEDSCRALRCLVLHSKECKDRVLTANGVGVIEKVMNENFNVSTVQECTHLLLDELLQ